MLSACADVDSEDGGGAGGGRGGGGGEGGVRVFAELVAGAYVRVEEQEGRKKVRVRRGGRGGVRFYIVLS